MSQTQTQTTTTRIHPLSSPALTPTIVKRLSSTSVRTLNDVPLLSSAASFTSSTGSINVEEGDVDVVTEEGLRHADMTLEARKYKSEIFVNQLLEVLSILRVPLWREADITAETVKIYKVSGSLTNAVFFVSCPAIPLLPTFLLRIYGPSSGSLVSRPRELHTLHILSSEYQFGPRVYGTFGNGRIEEYFDSVTLTAADLRDPQISGWIAARMAELHCVDIEAVEQTSPNTRGEGKGWEIGAKKNVKAWSTHAQEVLVLPAVSDISRNALDLNAFKGRWDQYMAWLKKFEAAEGPSKRVFAHNDAQYGNLLRLTRTMDGLPEHHQIIVVDFEYASPNPAAFDIANHFHEWTADYHSSTPWILNPSRYPNLQERRNFYTAYLAQDSVSASSLPGIVDGYTLEDQLDKLDRQVAAWSPASQAMWAIWGIVQAREDLETHGGEPEFDYIGYAQCRMQGFYQEISAFGI